VPNYITDSAYTEDIPTRSKVGDAQGRSRMAMTLAETGDFKWVDHGQRVESSANPPQSEGSRQNQAQMRDRQVQLSMPLWSENGEQAVLMARSADNKDRWVMQLDPATGKTKVLDHLHDDAWVAGPGSNTLGWLPDNKGVYFQSERDGYAHLYTVSIDGGAPQQLTSGTFEVDSVRLSEDKTKFYFISSEIHPGEKQLYSMPVTGGARTRITSLSGHNQAFLSPDESTLALIRSYSNKPPELYLQPNRPGAEAKQITTSPTEEWLSYKWIDPPIVTFKARDGATVYARMYKPSNFQRGGPAVFFVHGAGYLQNVHRGWSNYFREYMFHHLLMERGYLVMDIDYRASAGYGRDWRTGIYRHMGGKDLSDHVDAARYLVSAHGVDAKRIGIYGGSYGGFITLMAMFTEPDVFAAGAALRPVTDWAHYNHGYTSNILNVPQMDAEAYRRSSPIYFAQGLKGALLICHGMVDVNVHFQDSVRLAQRLIELRKENWELAVYPVEDHGFVEPSSWADEYKRILKLFAPLHPNFNNASGGGKAESNSAPAKSTTKRKP
jgi:dipeptidyl aminopeptidase/acylaminoacyl peptidase